MVLGSGEVGSVVAKDLGSINETTQVCVADINLEAAQKLSQQIGSKADACRIDIYEKDGLLNSIKGYDVVVNTVGPFYKTGTIVLKACIDAKVNYVDIADDSAAVKELLKFEKACENAGITAIISHGVSPGVTNMLGLLGATKMDEVDEINTSWVESSLGSAIGPANIWHGLEMGSGMIPQFLDGKLVDVPAISEAESLKFREPLGEYPVYYVGHGEPVSLPKYIKGLKKVTNKGNLWPDVMDFNILTVYDKIGLAGTDTLKVGEVELCKRDIAAYSLLDIIDSLGETIAKEFENVEDIGFQVRVDVKGKIKGHPAHFVYTCFTDMNQSTGLSASYGAQSIASGKVNAKGLFAPEGCQDPNAFFQHLANKGFTIYETKTVESILKNQKELLAATI